MDGLNTPGVMSKPGGQSGTLNESAVPIYKQYDRPN